MCSTDYTLFRETHQVSVYSNDKIRRINQYEVVGDISRGVHGKVKLAHDTVSGARVAIKVMRRIARMSHNTDAIRREVAALKRVRHPNVITPLEIIDDPNSPNVYLVLEYAELGRLPWRKRGQDGVCRHEWDIIQLRLRSRGTIEMPDRPAPDLQVPRSGQLSPANQPPTTSPNLVSCKSHSEPVSSNEGATQSLSQRYGILDSVDTDIHRSEPIPKDFQYVPCITMEQARHAILDVVLGLECLNAHGIVHRDLKPQNLLWTKDYHVKIADFSTSFLGRPPHGTPFRGPSTSVEGELTVFDGEDEMVRTVGTPGFIAPELCCTRQHSTDLKTLQEADVWSLGVTLYCLIFARLPFIADDEYQLYRKMASQDVYIPRQRLRPALPSSDLPDPMLPMHHYRRDDVTEYEDVDKDLQDILQKMLTRNPQNRIRLTDIKKHPWLAHISPDCSNLQTTQSNTDDEYNIVFPFFWYVPNTDNEDL